MTGNPLTLRLRLKGLGAIPPNLETKKMSLFSVIETPEMFISRSTAERLASVVRKWGYRARIWTRQDRMDPTNYGFTVAVYSNNGFEGFAHAL